MTNQPVEAGHRTTLIEVFIQRGIAYLSIGGRVTALNMTKNPDNELMNLLLNNLSPDYIKDHLAEVEHDYD